MSFNTSIVVKHMRQIIRSYDPMCFSSFNEADRRLNSDGGQRGGIIGETQKLGGSVDLCMSQRFVGLWPFSAFQPNFTPKTLYKPDFDPAQYMFQPKMTLFTKPISLLTILLLFFTFHCILYQYSFILHWERATGSLRPSSSFFTGTERLLLVWVTEFSASCVSYWFLLCCFSLLKWCTPVGGSSSVARPRVQNNAPGSWSDVTWKHGIFVDG